MHNIASLFFYTVAALAVVISAAPAAEPIEKRASTVPGFDVSHYQGKVDMSKQAQAGAKFVIIKATESTGYTDSDFSANYESATKAKLIRGAYHFAHPDASSGAAQATYFLKNGGGWTADGQTLPGMLDIENNPSGANCYGLSAAKMVSWIKDFSDTYYAKTKRYPTIYTNNGWWTSCTGNSNAFTKTNALNIAHYGVSSPGTTGGWPYATFWQFADSGKYPGDQDKFEGTQANLEKFAKGG